MACFYLDLKSDFTAAVAKAAEFLRAGEIVVFPTETVYGVGADAENPGATAKLRRLKGRDGEKPFQLLVTGREMAEAMGAEFSIGAGRVARRYWPGPLTLVVPRAGGGTLGLRVPDNRFILSVVERLGRAVAASSANPGGMPPPTSAAAADVFADEVMLLVDGGGCRVGEASVVAVARGDEFDVVREGSITRADLTSVWKGRCHE